TREATYGRSSAGTGWGPGRTMGPRYAPLQRCGLQQLAELVEGQLADLADLQRPQPHRAEPGARQLPHRVPDVVEQPAHDPVAALVDDQLHDRLLLGRHHGAGPPHRDRTVVQLDALQQLPEGAPVDLAL